MQKHELSNPFSSSSKYFWLKVSTQLSCELSENASSLVLFSHSPGDQPQDILVPARLGKGEGSEAGVVLPAQVHHRLLHQVAHHLLQLPVDGKVEGSPASSLLSSLNVDALVDHQTDEGEQVLLDREVERELAQVRG